MSCRNCWDKPDDSTSEWFVTIRVSGAFPVIDALGVTMSEGKISVVACSSTVGPVAGTWPVNGSRMRETASERENVRHVRRNH